MAKKYENIIRIKSENGFEEYIYFLSDLDYELPCKNIIEGLKRMDYARHYNDEDLDVYNRRQLTIDDLEYI